MRSVGNWTREDDEGDGAPPWSITPDEVQSRPWTLLLSAVGNHRSFHSPKLQIIIQAYSACQYRTEQTNLEHALSRFATAPRILQSQNTSNVSSTAMERRRQEIKASFQKWRVRLERILAQLPSNSESLLSVSTSITVPSVHYTNAILLVARRKTLFDDRPVEISVSHCLAAHSQQYQHRRVLIRSI